MPKKTHDVIIVGAGVSGLACANQLKDKREFLITTESIGGRIAESKNGKYNYGAYFIGKDYDNFAKYARKKERISLASIEFHDRKKSWHLRAMISRPIQAGKFFLILRKFDRRYKKFKKECLQNSQKKVISEDRYLQELYSMRADRFLKDKNLKKLYDKYIDPLMRSCSFSKPSEYNAFELLHYSRYIFIPTYTFKFLKNKITKGFKNKIVKDTIIEIKKRKNHYLLQGLSKQYRAKNVVVATPPAESKKLLKIKQIKKPASCYIFHLKGKLNNKWKQSRFDVFYKNSEVYGLAEKEDGTYFLCTRNPNPAFKKYFEKSRLIKKIYWEKAFHMNGNVLWGMEQEKGLYLIGDHNVCGLEEAFITGICAANKILSE